ncbi:MAG: DUF4838 domain-containing protein [Pseudomonadota bacterium]
MRLARLSCMLLLITSCGGGGESGDPQDIGGLDHADGIAEVSSDGIADISPDVDAVEGEPVPLVTGGASDHVIVLPGLPTASQLHAAEELRSSIEACTGVSLEVVQGPPDGDPPMIVLGIGPTAEALGVAPTSEALGEQGFALRTVPPHIVIAGTPEAGTLFGVHRFLEDVLGVRWYAPGVTRTPALADVVVPPMDRVERPAFFWRHTSYEWPGGDAAFWTRQGDNQGSTDLTSPYGVKHKVMGSAHSYHHFVHPDVYFDEHPEYFSEIGGVRVRDETQLCLTNPDVLDIVAAGMIQWMTDEPDGHQYRFSQQDYYNYCTCDACTAMNAQYGTTGGTQFWFTNELAKRTAAVHPDKLVATLAYMYTEEPPEGLDMHPNASVWLCHMFPSCDSHPIATCPRDADYKQRAEEWSVLTDHLYIWHYVVDFTHYYNPFPNLRAMASDAKFYRDIGVEGIYLQGMGHGGGGGEFSLLRPWYGMKLLWDPDVDAAALLRDFLQGYYGAAWEPMEAWIDRIHDKVTDDDVHMHLYTNPGQGYLPDEIVAEGETLFDEAEALVAGDEELTDRVRVARMPLTYARLFPRNGYEIVGDTLSFLGEIAPISDVQEFLQTMADHGFGAWMEFAGSPDNLALIYSMFAMDHGLKVIDNGLLRVEVVPNLGGRALRIIHKATGESITAYNRIQNLYFPFAGGLEDRTGELFRFYGWVEPAAISDHDALSITTTQSTMDGMTIRRTLTLAADAPVLHVESRLMNPKGGDEVGRIRTHLELDLGPLGGTTVSFTDLGGDAVAHDMSSVIAGLREGRHYYDQQAPAGEWTFSGAKGLDVTWRFDSDEVDFTWLYAYPEDLQALEAEVWSPQALLEPGAEVVLHHELEIHPSPR